MPSPGSLLNLEVAAQYGRDGLSRAMPLIRKLMAAFESDSTTVPVITRLNATNVSSGGEATTWTNAAVKLYALHIAQPSTTTATGFVQLFNTSTASVTLGTTVPDVSFKLPATATDLTVVFVPGNNTGIFTSALSYAVSTAAGGGTGVNSTNTPVVTFVTNR